MSESNKPTTVFWVVAILAVVWYILGAGAYLGSVFITEEAIAELPEARQNYMANVPAWATAAFAISVWGGLLACIGLLMRKKWAVPLFMLSLLAVFVHAAYTFFIQTDIELSGTVLIQPVAVIVISIFLVWYSKDAKNKGVLS